MLRNALLAFSLLYSFTWDIESLLPIIATWKPHHDNGSTHCKASFLLVVDVTHWLDSTKVGLSLQQELSSTLLPDRIPLSNPSSTLKSKKRSRRGRRRLELQVPMDSKCILRDKSHGALFNTIVTDHAACHQGFLINSSV